MGRLCSVNFGFFGVLWKFTFQRRAGVLASAPFRMIANLILAGFLSFGTNTPVHTLDIGMPTANAFLLEPGSVEKFFQATISGTWESGQYGCVRMAANGRRLHEGVDIKCLDRDHKGEPIDPVYAVAEGTVAFINVHPGNSNYGRYIILRHVWDGVEVFTLYAHLREITGGLRAGHAVTKGQPIAVIGRSTNTREGITRDRAHLHFEINFMINNRFARWYAKRDPKAPDFGNYNGQNFIGIDPAAFLRALQANPSLNFNEYFRQQTEAFRVLVGPRAFPWLKMHPETVQPHEGTPAAYEVVMNWVGLPIQIIPRTADRVSGERGRTPILKSVNEDELARNNCRHLVKLVKGKWTLSVHGEEWIDLLTYVPGEPAGLGAGRDR